MAEETVRDGLTILKPPPGALLGGRTEDGEEFRLRLLAALDHGDLLVDLSAIEGRGDISVGLRALMIGARAARTQDRAMFVAAPGPILREKMMISRYYYVLPMFDTLDDAIEAYATGDLSKAIGEGAAERHKLPARLAAKSR